jgi:hypothetical protein
VKRSETTAAKGRKSPEPESLYFDPVRAAARSRKLSAEAEARNAERALTLIPSRPMEWEIRRDERRAYEARIAELEAELAEVTDVLTKWELRTLRSRPRGRRSPTPKPAATTARPRKRRR